ncbi:MAG: hypothetical protein PHC80_04635, partial [Eubacteriales bacterium]|nr:hypothetical protein [Eubacteriales bacterium]
RNAPCFLLWYASTAYFPVPHRPKREAHLACDRAKVSARCAGCSEAELFKHREFEEGVRADDKRPCAPNPGK